MFYLTYTDAEDAFILNWNGERMASLDNPRAAGDMLGLCTCAADLHPLEDLREAAEVVFILANREALDIEGGLTLFNHDD